MNDHHRKDGKWLKREELIDSVTKTKAHEPSRLSGGDSFVTLQLFIACRPTKLNHNLVLFTKSVRFGRAELSFFLLERVYQDLRASLLSFCPRLLMNDHNKRDGKWFKDKEPIDAVTKAESKEPSRFSGGDFFITLRPYIACRSKK